MMTWYVRSIVLFMGFHDNNIDTVRVNIVIVYTYNIYIMPIEELYLNADNFIHKKSN